MSTASRRAEANEASTAFQIALTQIGAQTTAEALRLWQDVPNDVRPEAAATWLRRAVQLVLFRRRQSRALARAYYRLIRALHTGSTVADPDKPEPTYITISTLRREFAELVGEAPEPAVDEQTGEILEPAEFDAAEAEDEELDRLLVEEIERIKEDEARIEREAQREAELDLAALGPLNLAKKREEIGDELLASEADRLRDEAHMQAGARQGSAAGRLAMDGARSTLWNYGQRDRKVLGFIRLSRTGTPCGWCAMLISRGPVYRSAEGTGPEVTFGDLDKYHDNCNCYAMPVFSREQYDSSDLYELNRKYQELWPEVTRGLSGKAALSAWRYFVRQEQKAAALEARRNPNAQEA